MKFLLMGDTHFGVRNNSMEVFNKMIKIFDLAEDICKKEDIHHFVHYGDLFHNQTLLSKNIAFLVKKRIENFIKNAKIEKAFFIPGNHDVNFRNDVSVNSQNILFGDDSKNIYVVNEPVKYNNMIFVPWIIDNEKEQIQTTIKSLIALSDKNKDVLILNGHFDKAGFNMSGNFKSEYDSLPDDLTFKFDRVISGHYHDKQEKGKWNYLGTPFQTRRGEEADKGLFVLDDEKNELQYYPNKDSEMFIEFISETSNFVDWKTEADKIDFKDKFVDCTITTISKEFIDSVYNYLAEAKAFDVKLTVNSPETNTEISVDLKDILLKKISLKDSLEKLITETLGETYGINTIKAIKNEIFEALKNIE